jgi:nitrite reductase/ring-hydroxylating ferredoxin subunit/putative flippase GtrA
VEGQQAMTNERGGSFGDGVAVLEPPTEPASDSRDRADATLPAAGSGRLATFARFVLFGGGVGLASSAAVPVVATVLPWAIANALITVLSTLLCTELHARFTFRTGRRAGWDEHLKSAGSAVAAYLATSAAMVILHAVQPSAGLFWDQAMYLGATGLAGIVRFLVLRLYVFAGRGGPEAESRAVRVRVMTGAGYCVRSTAAPIAAPTAGVHVSNGTMRRAVPVHDRGPTPRKRGFMTIGIERATRTAADPHTARRRAVLTGACAIGVGGVLAACGDGDSDTSDTSTAASAPSAGATSGPLAATADVAIGGGVVVGGVLVVQPVQGTFKAYDAACPHQGARVGAPQQNVVTCPAHRSKFKAEDGSLISGPATRGLTEIAVTVQGSEVVRA